MPASQRLPDYLEGLNEAQASAVTHWGEPLLILAGAGSGKTRVIIHKIAWLIREQGLDPRSILAVTFTNKAAGEMRNRASSLVEGGSNAMIRTFHSFGAWMLRRNHEAAGLPSGFSIYDDDDTVSLLKSLFPEEKKGTLTKWSRAISRAKDYALGPEDPLDEIDPTGELPEIYRAYHDRLREIGNVDFGDLIMRPMELLRDNTAVRNRFHQRYRAILVDEYQDSNVAQFKFLSYLAGEGSYICVVGDDDQSIYRFRGAEVRNILTFHEHFPGTRIVRLEQNYRSTEPILQLAGSVVERNEGRLGKKLWTDRCEGPKPRLALLPDADSEVELCMRIIEQGRNPGDTAILYRTNAQSRLFETELLRAGIAYRIIGTVRFYEREEVKDILALLRFIANPRDEVSFRRIVNKPSRGLGAKSVDRIVSTALAEGRTLREVLAGTVQGLSKKADTGRQALASVLEGLDAALEGESLPAFVDTVAEQSGLKAFHAEQDEYAGTQKLANIEELVNAAGMYDAGRDGLTEFLEMIELDSGRDGERDDDENAVTLITMHNTKGLEFPRVIITGLEDGLFPRGGEESADEIEEERRLFYVAVTRAKDELYLTSCRYRRLYGRITEFPPSRFLGEIPAEYVDVTSGTYGGDGAGGTSSVGGTSAAGDGDDSADWGEAADLGEGAGVFHDEYGTGMVIKRWRKGRNVMVRVRFESGAVASFIPRYTPLERVSIEE
ncbi:MAG: ATP-dependent helicase [Spirochaetota bacterium]